MNSLYLTPATPRHPADVAEDIDCPRCRGDGYLTIFELTDDELDCRNLHEDESECTCPDCNGDGTVIAKPIKPADEYVR